MSIMEERTAPELDVDVGLHFSLPWLPILIAPPVFTVASPDQTQRRCACASMQVVCGHTNGSRPKWPSGCMWAAGRVKSMGTSLCRCPEQ